jgi:hypothetical protein
MGLMAISTKQTSLFIENEIARKANFNINFNNKIGLNGAGNPVVSGFMSASNMILNLQDGTTVQIDNVAPLDNYDHFVSGSASVPVSKAEAIQDWANC